MLPRAALSQNGQKVHNGRCYHEAACPDGSGTWKRSAEGSLEPDPESEAPQEAPRKSAKLVSATCYQK